MKMLEEVRFEMTKSIINKQHKKQNASKLIPQPTMHDALRFILIMPQFFGIFPLYGVTNKDYRSIKFKYLSLRFFYSIYCISGGIMMLIFCCIKFAMNGLMLDKTATLTFYFCNIFGPIQFINIAKKWKAIMGEWYAMDIRMRKYGAFSQLKIRFRVSTTLIMSLALCEHTLFILNALNGAKSCINFDMNPTEIYFGVAFPHVFTLISYSHAKAAYFEIANILTTFAWNYMDLFIIILSSALALRFKQINTRLEKNLIMHEHFWREIREDYNRLCRLCKTIDDNICPLVAISFINNLFFICVQLYNSIKPRYGIIETSYFFYSFGFLLARTMAVTLYAAWINDESRKPLKVLHTLASEHFGTEVNRLIEQIYTNPVGLTGYRFFMVTRGLLLRLAGTIVTFELMLLQFGPILSADHGLLDSAVDCIK